MPRWPGLAALLFGFASFLTAQPPTAAVSIPMRDGITLAGWLMRPDTTGRHPTLVYRTPYGAERALKTYATFEKARARGYAVLAVDVRGRYGSAGEFDPYRQERADGYDTIEWAAGASWSDGRVGTFGLSYPGAVQWLAAIEAPPHLRAMVPAMTFARPANFWYAAGLVDLSWPAWIWLEIAPDVRVRRRLAGPRTAREARDAWAALGPELARRRPLANVPELQTVAPWYLEWLAHPADDPWWSWADLTAAYPRVSAAVLNLSGWHDDPYGPEGAVTNHLGLLASRRGAADPRTQLVLGPWVHGVSAIGDRGSAAASGERVFGAAAGIDYDEEILRFLDRYVRDLPNGADRAPRVRVFVMGENVWRSADSWPLPGTREIAFHLEIGRGLGGRLASGPAAVEARAALLSDPSRPVVDPFAGRPGAHDHRELAAHEDVLVFESEPLASPLRVVGAARVELFVSVDAPDADLFARLFDVAPDGTAWNLMSPGLDGMRLSYRDGPRRLLEPGRVYPITLGTLLTGNRFAAGHRIRLVVSTSLMPHFAPNLHTGRLDTESAEWRRATVTLHAGGDRPARLVLPVVP